MGPARVLLWQVGASSRRARTAGVRELRQAEGRREGGVPALPLLPARARQGPSQGPSAMLVQAPWSLLPAGAARGQVQGSLRRGRRRSKWEAQVGLWALQSGCVTGVTYFACLSLGPCGCYRPGLW